MNKHQIEALAWLIYAGGGTCDFSDVRPMLDDGYYEERLGIVFSDAEKDRIAERVGEIRFEVQEKAHRKVNAAFRKVHGVRYR